MELKMNHITMFKSSDNNLGYIQVVTSFINKEELESIGFVDHVDRIKKSRAKIKPKTKAVSKND